MAKHLLPKAFALLAFSFAPAPAFAQSMVQATAGSLAWSKTDAILGGTPSALEAILAQQSGAPAPARVPLQPASYSYARPPVASAAIRFGPSPGAWNGRPDVFGSVALRVNHTPLDGRWKGVEHSQVDGAAAHFAEAQRG